MIWHHWTKTPIPPKDCIPSPPPLTFWPSWHNEATLQPKKTSYLIQYISLPERRNYF